MKSSPLRLGYLVAERPTQTHVFFWREAQALVGLGVELFWISTRRPSVACPHAFGVGAAAATHYVVPPRIGPALRMLLRPRGLTRALGYLAEIQESVALRRLAREGDLAQEMGRAARTRATAAFGARSCAASLLDRILQAWR